MSNQNLNTLKPKTLIYVFIMIIAFLVGILWGALNENKELETKNNTLEFKVEMLQNALDTTDYYWWKKKE